MMGKTAHKLVLTTFGVLSLAAVSLADKPVEKTKPEFKLDERVYALKLGQITPGTRDAINRVNTLWGHTGLIFIPTAYVAGQNTFSIGANFADGVRGPSANYGIVRDVEIGGAYLDLDGRDDKALANAKVRIVPANFDTFEIGIGITDAFDALDQTIYVVGSVDLIVPEQAAQRGGFALKAHAGIGTGYFNEKPFGGLELFFDDGFSVVGEYDTKTINAALRYRHNDDFTVQAGIFSNSLLFGLNYHMRF